MCRVLHHPSWANTVNTHYNKIKTIVCARQGSFAGCCYTPAMVLTYIATPLATQGHEEREQREQDLLVAQSASKLVSQRPGRTQTRNSRHAMALTRFRVVAEQACGEARPVSNSHKMPQHVKEAQDAALVSATPLLVSHLIICACPSNLNHLRVYTCIFCLFMCLEETKGIRCAAGRGG